MGGNALKNCATRRFHAEEYYILEQEVVEMLEDVFILSKIKPILAYRCKESMGDMDILVESDCIPNNWMELLKKKFQPKETLKNGNVFSFEYKKCQIDLILIKKEEFESSYQYFNYNDLGNLVGRVAHSMGLKLGHDGLTFKFMGAERYVFKEIKLLDDWKDILPVLGYSYERYEQDFNTLEDIFEFVVSSPFFNKSIYALENRNHEARTRDKKRATYMKFLKWLEGYEETAQQICSSNLNFYKATKHHTFQSYLFEKIPSFKEQYEASQIEFEQAQEYKKRFNGELVSQWTGLKEKHLGEFMKWLKGHKEQERWKKDIVAMNSVLVEGLVMYYYEKYKEILGV